MAIGLLRRGVILWLLARAMVVSVSAAFSGQVSVRLLPPTACALALGVGALGFLDARRRNEHRFLANLGISPIVIALICTIPPLVGELAIGVARSR